ncbi:hsp70 family chaperone [Diplodia corticola]|uniref:Hsp70 family chaperone n=1 Tax=Diplodia corticola TaxID=236234 RepID=A0A1J9RJC8_9PEZI|nr:hsp70 family chaperone [Diplodia corticola]OJD32667.1 hsp70 family chaperone [Diplodia corticola]
MESSDPCLVIGIDFGTTFSGFAYAFSEQLDREEPTVLTSWRTTGTFNSDDAKVPSKICYDDDKILWGFEDSPEEETLRWFKLLLVDETDLRHELRDSKYLKRARELMERNRKTPVQVAADYLQCLWAHAEERMEREQGYSAVTSLPFKIVLTVPAIWPEKSKGRMIQAAKMAGLNKKRLAGETTISLVSEPEAAALATLADFRGRSDVKSDDIYIVCDAGGGTVDIITYQIERTEPMVMEEYVRGEGKLCGAVLLDEAFENTMKLSLGKKWGNLDPDVVKQFMETEWERGVKRAYRGTAQSFTVRLPVEAFAVKRLNLHKPMTDKKKDITDGKIRLESGHMKSIFDPVIQKIHSLVDQQVSEIEKKGYRKPKAIILVGGFGGSDFLYQQLRREQCGRGIEILQPSGSKPWTAICRGAALRAGTSFHGSHVASRISRISYGVRYNTRFVEGKHLEGDKYWCKVEGAYFAQQQMEWYLKRGTRLDDQRAVKLTWIRHVAELPDQLFSTTVFGCSESDPPDRCERTVNALCEVSCRLPLAFESLPVVIGWDNRPYRRISYVIEMTPTDSGLEWAVSMDGVRIGQENVEVEYE